MTAALLIGIPGALVAWRVSLWLYPWKTCPACDGGRRIQGGGGIHRDCGRCGATGRVRRWGAPRGERR